ncbi:hypothetical protein OE88DRAFT_1653592 [Heliocybe sulcata]|uniref:Uncharacterized protein n=1 Tax=Heliocybe sulcata TaxID=5364 RepID=A0A5C3NCH2_9AGAM|nr:hypothetical protein OE88DRAFT_1653592 [Heliocybe sulcata]
MARQLRVPSSVLSRHLWNQPFFTHDYLFCFVARIFIHSFYLTLGSGFCVSATAIHDPTHHDSPRPCSHLITTAIQ